MKSFEDAYESAQEGSGPVSLLLGNGFSIAADRSFDYRRLLDRATFGGPTRAERVLEIFDTLDTADFEMVIRRLESAAEILDSYSAGTGTAGVIRRDARVVRQALTETLASIHPDRIGDIGDDRLDECHDFIAAFDSVFTTNYDLLLYWAVNRKDRAHFKDGFGRIDGRLLHVEPGAQNVSWLHGAVHLHEELVAGDSPITVKREWALGSSPLVDRLREDLEEGDLPLMVMEGTWQQKQRKINSSPYLTNSLQLLRGLSGSLFTYGSSLGENDFHILRAVENSQITHLYLGLYGSSHSGSNPDTVGQAHALRAATGDRIRVRLWNTETAPVW